MSVARGLFMPSVFRNHHKHRWMRRKRPPPPRQRIITPVTLNDAVVTTWFLFSHRNAVAWSSRTCLSIRADGWFVQKYMTILYAMFVHSSDSHLYGLVEQTASTCNGSATHPPHPLDPRGTLLHVQCYEITLTSGHRRLSVICPRTS